MDDGEATPGDLLTLAELTARETLDDLEFGPAHDWIAQRVDMKGVMQILGAGPQIAAIRT